MEATKQTEPRGMSVNVRRRKSTMTIPVQPGVTIIKLEMRTEFVDGQPVVTYFPPDGTVLSHEKKNKTTLKAE